MEADDLLCSRNARPQKEGKGAARCPSCSQNAHGVKLCSFDARSKGRPWPLPLERYRESEGYLSTRVVEIYPAITWNVEESFL